MKNENTLETYPGLVVAYFGDRVEVETSEGTIIPCHLHRNQELPVVGDCIRWKREDSESGTVTEILPRRSLLTRPDSRGKLKPAAANLDVIIIVMALPVFYSEFLIDRYIVAAELLKIKPILVLNKTDLFTPELKAEMDERLAVYRHIGYPVILSSTYTQEGLHDFGKFLQDKTGMLVGPSGVGKSSIIAAFVKGQPIRVGEMSYSGTGKHTTTTTRLYHLPGGGYLIDSPGIREFNLWQVTREEILRGFIEFRQFASECRFRDCRHLTEPGCAVQQAVESGDICLDRFESYQRLIAEAVS